MKPRHVIPLIILSLTGGGCSYFKPNPPDCENYALGKATRAFPGHGSCDVATYADAVWTTMVQCGYSPEHAATTDDTTTIVGETNGTQICVIVRHRASDPNNKASKEMVLVSVLWGTWGNLKMSREFMDRVETNLPEAYRAN